MNNPGQYTDVVHAGPRAERKAAMNRRTPKPPRRGVAVLVVLLLISFTLALSYAAVRSQYTGLLIHQNAQRRGSARHAAMVGMTMAIKKMHQESWGGVDSVLAGTLTDTEGYAVSFTTGDPSLDESDPDYDDLPYRVTVLSTGYAADPENPARKSEHRIRAVLRLIPRALSDEPAGLDDITGHTVCQWNRGFFFRFHLDVPFRTTGPVRIRDRLRLGDELHWTDDARWQYLEDLKETALGGGPDYRPFTGPVTYPYWRQRASTRALVTGALGVSEQDGSASTDFDWPDSDVLGSYRLYPGGKQYSPQLVADELRDVTLEPDPEDNPLGIFGRGTAVRIYENVTLRGTLVTRGAWFADVNVYGQNVQLGPCELPPLEGETTPIRLPTLICDEDLRFQPGSQVTATGIVIARDKFEVVSGPQDAISLAIRGNAAGKNFHLRERSDWDHNTDWWKDRWAEFEAQRGAKDGIDDFPLWLETQWGLKREPQLVIEAEDDPPRYHWYNPENPIFVVHPDDDGLRWNLLEWTENP